MVDVRQSLDISHTKHTLHEAFVASICQENIKKCFIRETHTQVACVECTSLS